ncbi:chaperonin 10-like protein [Mycena maculata]|uniref:Chaperonin 10-like protein n=1 Tax=Mycena maculata TaxID=230809 RepID=A0AAD7JAJ7_9AGAR|nr:chaperonin 10-like protein [Mycena maculata]
MRAVVCPSVPISPAQLIYTTTHPAPQPKSGHVLIRIKAFGLNRSELYTRQGQSPGLVFPRVLGIECVGVVKDAGGGKWKEGDVVAAIMGGMGREFDGGYAEYTLVPHSSVSPAITLPKNVGWENFAAIPETFMTAWGTLHTSLKLQSIDTLFIHGGTSSVGLACAALAKCNLFNVSTVISTTRSSQKVPAVQAAGADHVIVDTGSVSAEVKKLTGGVGATKAVELVGPPTLEDSCAALAPDGVIASVGSLSGVWRSEFDPSCLAPNKHLTKFSSGTVNMSTAPLQQIVDAVGTGEIKVNLDKVFDISKAGDAHAYMEANSAAGKVVCVVD